MIHFRAAFWTVSIALGLVGCSPEQSYRQLPVSASLPSEQQVDDTASDPDVSNSYTEEHEVAELPAPSVVVTPPEETPAPNDPDVTVSSPTPPPSSPTPTLASPTPTLPSPPPVVSVVPEVSIQPPLIEITNPVHPAACGDAKAHKILVCHVPHHNDDKSQNLCVSVAGAVHGHGIRLDGSASLTGDYVGPCR